MFDHFFNLALFYSDSRGRDDYEDANMVWQTLLNDWPNGILPQNRKPSRMEYNDSREVRTRRSSKWNLEFDKKKKKS